MSLSFLFDPFCINRMIRFRTSLIKLLGLYLMFSEDHSGCCLDTVRQPPSVSINRLQAISDKQSLLVSWWVNHSSLVGDVYEIQISRTENHTVIYNRNLSLFSGDSDAYTWTWISDVPLECVDHSVRIRHFHNQSVGPWSDWITNHGAQARNKTRIFPFQRVLREHTNTVFCCVPPRGVSITNMTFNNSIYPLISVGARVKAIAVPNLTIPAALIKHLSLSCGDATGKITYAWNYISFPPQKPRNLRCGTSDMITVICTWDSGRERDPDDCNKQTQNLHIENSDQAPINCEQSSCTFPAVTQLEEYIIRVVVKDQLGEETESYSFNISDRVFPVAEVDRVSPGVTHATVSWIVRGNLTQLDLFCQVTTDPDGTAELICNSVRGLCEVKLDHLFPNTCYSTRVRCSASGRLWGDWTQPVSFTTYPMVSLDVWRRITQLSDSSSRHLTLFWTPHVPGSAAEVNIEGYVVQWSQDGQNRTEWKDGGQTQAEVSISPGQYDFAVRAVVHDGSTIPAHITIPQRDDGEIPVKKRLSGSIAACFNLSWEHQDTVTCGYTVEWCIQGNAVPCALRWLKVPEGHNTLLLPAGNFKAGCRYTFNIYGCTENGHRLLEVQTGYSQELKSVQSPRLDEPVQSTSSSVTLKWSYNEDDPAHPAFITGYLVMAPEVGSGPFIVTVADPRRKSVTIGGLQQNRKYAFSVSALTKDGSGLPTNITVRTRTNYSAHVAKTLTPILLLVGCIILLWPQRKMLRSGLKEIFTYPAGMNIKPPELDSFLHETSERLQSQKIDECSNCDIEILNTRPHWDETTPLRDPEPLNTLPPAGSKPSPAASSLSCVSLQADYCPQSVTVVWDRPALQQITCITDETSLHTAEEDLSEAQQVMFAEIQSNFEPSESLQDSCILIYGYVSNDISEVLC